MQRESVMAKGKINCLAMCQQVRADCFSKVRALTEEASDRVRNYVHAQLAFLEKSSKSAYHCARELRRECYSWMKKDLQGEGEDLQRQRQQRKIDRAVLYALDGLPAVFDAVRYRDLPGAVEASDRIYSSS